MALWTLGRHTANSNFILTRIHPTESLTPKVNAITALVDCRRQRLWTTSTCEGARGLQLQQRILEFVLGRPTKGSSNRAKKALCRSGDRSLSRCCQITASAVALRATIIFSTHSGSSCSAQVYVSVTEAPATLSQRLEKDGQASGARSFPRDRQRGSVS